METTITSTNFQFGHDTTAVIKVQPPEMVPFLDEHGDEIIGDDGRPVMGPPDDWQPTPEQVDLDTIVVLDVTNQATPVIFKFVCEKETLANFVAEYVQHLDVDGRQVVRNALDRASGIIVPDPSEFGKLRLA